MIPCDYETGGLKEICCGDFDIKAALAVHCSANFAGPM